MMGVLGDVAQLAERFVRNEEVVGSTPIVSTPGLSRGFGRWVALRATNSPNPLNPMLPAGARRAAVFVLGLSGAFAGHGVAAASSASPLGFGRTALAVLGTVPVMLEHRGGYDRGVFPGWVDADRDGCDTRAEVLRRESKSPVRTKSTRCTVVAGNWLSAYDGVVVNDPSRLEIDHVVSLKEAWDSGAWAWTSDRRAAYANDLSDARTLRAVSVASNRAKGEKDPSNWLPVLEDQCRYLGDWVAIKARWGMSADQSEWGRIRNVLRARCPGLTVVSFEAKSLPSSPVPFVGAEPTSTAGKPADVNDPAMVSYRNCAEVRAAGAAPLRRGDPGYRSGLDRDNDGVACE